VLGEARETGQIGLAFVVSGQSPAAIRGIAMPNDIVAYRGGTKPGSPDGGTFEIAEMLERNRRLRRTDRQVLGSQLSRQVIELFQAFIMQAAELVFALLVQGRQLTTDLTHPLCRWAVMIERRAI